jgi:predicted cobalt transporter CbtA
MVTAAGYAIAAVVITSQTGPPAMRRQLLTGLSGFMVLGTALNLASRSRAERLLWTPVAALTAVSAWQARREVI